MSSGTVFVLAWYRTKNSPCQKRGKKDGGSARPRSFPIQELTTTCRNMPTVNDHQARFPPILLSLEVRWSLASSSSVWHVRSTVPCLGLRDCGTWWSL